GIDEVDLPLSNCNLQRRLPVYNNVSHTQPNASAFSDYLETQFDYHPLERLIAIYCNDAVSGTSVIMANYTAFHAYGEGLAVYYKMNADSQATGDAGTMTVANYAMPWTNK